MAARGSEQRALAALVEGTRLVAAAVDLEQALDALAAQTRTLLDADDVTISLVVPGTDQLVRQRASALAAPASSFAAVGGPVEPNELTLEGDRSGRAVYAA